MYSLTAVANSEWLYGTCTQDWLLLHVGTNQLFKNVETMSDNKSQCTRSHLGFKTHTNAGVKVLFPWYHYPNTHKPLYYCLCKNLSDLTKIRTWSSNANKPELFLHLWFPHAKKRHLWWRLSFTQCDLINMQLCW